MAVQQIVEFQSYIGLSTDTKPTAVAPGSKFYATDTGENFIWDGSNWHTDLSLIHALSQVIK